MAVDLQGRELLLPSQFLTDNEDDILLEKNPTNHNNRSSFKTGVIPHWFGSQLSSLVHFTEPERDDKNQDFIAGLTRHMAYCMFQDDDNLAFTSIGSENQEMLWGSANSPQSTVWSPMGSSNHGSSDGCYREASPPATPVTGKDPFWESSYNLVGKFEEMNFNDKGGSDFHYVHGAKNPIVGLNSNPALTDDQIRAIQLFRLKQEQILKLKNRAYWERQAQMSQQSELKEKIPQYHKKGRVFGVSPGNGRKARPLNLSSSNRGPSTLSLQQQQSQQQSGSGMRALFLGRSDSKSGSCGTGVFLPRSTGASSESRKKPGCSTALVPARVVQALQQHFDQMGVTSGAKADVLVNNKDGMYSLQKRQVPASNHNETSMRLPQEWTY
ncbi:G patch domain-containing 3 [Quillaja saponaria]|uniref:G patch domain-containing 3 n=1 Tax=Quillaja saponaria TaxID=32244 RepID=A0AAD7QGB9_QUISA|nr:G patch domain-containing 3 [Quillaja saponaria]